MPPPHRIRAATPADLDVLVRHRRGMWDDMAHGSPGERDAHDAVYRDWAAEGLKDGTFHAWIAEDATSGAPLASGAVWVRPVQPFPGAGALVEPYLLSMYTEPAARGSGLARGIVEAAVAWARAEGHVRMRLHASEMGRALYARLGFERSWEMRLELGARPLDC